MIGVLNISDIKKAYFIGIGGIGMSAIARYFISIGVKVFGYDKTPSALTEDLMKEGCQIEFVDDPATCVEDADVVVYTPAIPSDSRIMHYYHEREIPLLKRSEVLGVISKDSFNICIAGTHGKTTVSTMVAHLLRDTAYGCNAFLGGISSNYGTNFWSSKNNCTVIEADEYDRSFLKLHPNIIAITSMDPDHLDIYGTAASMEDAFLEFAGKLDPKGLLLTKKGLSREQSFSSEQHVTYHISREDAGIHTIGLQIVNGHYQYDVKGPEWKIDQIQLHMGGMHNVENSLVAIGIAKQLGIVDDKIREAIASFKGVKRRFEYIVKTEEHIYIDDYAHHPEELRALISSAKLLYPTKKCTLIFQPHLYSRTRDFASEFAESLSLADETILLPIYPARELPIEGVTSSMIANQMKSNVQLIAFEDVATFVKSSQPSLIITAGAGNIDRWIEPIKNILLNQ
ncbi:MAG: UDP-N-acetylmuramate--L-alanine ligase [Chitinophagia bacterium]|nr:UDP-N-acetylmuramate--L-alanine ligase [Chitinophagia bacterium]